VISLAMIVRDEAATLDACLGSVEDAVDEIVIVDTGSADETIEIARAHGARVVEWAWRDDFAAARNEALRHVRGDWVLVLDADERLALGSAERVRAAVAIATSIDGFNCRLVSTLPPTEPAPSIVHWYCRLFRRRADVAYEGRIHEQVAPSIVRAGGRIAQSDIVILHEGYATPSPSKLARNIALLRRELADRPDDAFARFNLGLTLFAAGDIVSARNCFEELAVLVHNPLPRQLQAVTWMKVAELRLTEGRWRDAAAAAERALALEPDLALARFTLGRALFEQGAFQAAELLFDELADAPADALGMVLHPRLIAVARAVTMLRRRRGTEAAAVLEPVAADDPTGEALFHLGNAHLLVGRLADAAEAYRLAHDRGLRDPGLDRRLALCTKLSAVASTALGRARR
jgi:tetratricopeptide (TPR) repeat protein